MVCFCVSVFLWCVHCFNQVLTFKEINWQSLRIEADAIESDDQDLGSTPLRLITNQGRIRIALKRRVRPRFYHSFTILPRNWLRIANETSSKLQIIRHKSSLILHCSVQIKDCNVLASKLLFILDDLLWVLTDSQLKAIIHYAKSLSEAMEKSAQQRKSRAAESLQVLPPSRLWMF